MPWEVFSCSFGGMIFLKDQVNHAIGGIQRHTPYLTVIPMWYIDHKPFSGSFSPKGWGLSAAAEAKPHGTHPLHGASFRPLYQAEPRERCGPLRPEVRGFLRQWNNFELSWLPSFVLIKKFQLLVPGFV